MPRLGQPQPNILVIMSDEHRWDVAGCYENEIVNTPKIDALAEKGITFDACYTPSPLCVPARLAFTAGQYVSRIGAWNNNSWISNEQEVTLPGLLVEQGYETVLCGKMHYDRTRRYGFQVDMGIGNQAFKNGCERRRHPDTLVPQEGISKRFSEFYTGSESPILSHDLEVTAKAKEFLGSRKGQNKPFFMLAGYLAPHFPLIVPEKYWKKYQDQIPLPKIPSDFLASLPLNYRHLRNGFQVENVPDHYVKLGRELYYGLTEWLDEQIGVVLQALDESGMADNTIVVYTSDHGENLGDHGLWWKNGMYDQATRVPLIVTWPKRWRGGQRRQRVCSLLDVVQTIVDWAGGEAPEHWDGTSMSEWLDDSESDWKDVAVSQYYAHNIASGYAMIRKGPHKLVYHSPASPNHPAEYELYDLNVDPGEYRNLAKDPAYRRLIDSLFAALVSETGEHPDVVEDRCRAEISQGYGRRKEA